MATEIDDGGRKEKCEKLTDRLKNLNWLSGSAEIIQLNGPYILTLDAKRNRRSSEARQLEEIIKHVTKEFRGAFGLIHELYELTETCYGRGRLVSDGSSTWSI